MSLGRDALEPGIFSAAAATTIRLIGSSAAIAAFMVPRTLAAPHMSHFISSMPAEALMLMPPVSKVMPLPTSTTGRSPRLPPL